MKKQTMKINIMKKQKGMTLISWIVVLAFVGFQFMMAIKILPVFAEDHTIASFWNKLGDDPALVGATPKAIRESVLKKLKINNVYALHKDDIVITKSDGYYIVSVEYEPRGQLIGKLDYIASFSHEARIRISN